MENQYRRRTRPQQGNGTFIMMDFLRLYSRRRRLIYQKPAIRVVTIHCTQLLLDQHRELPHMFADTRLGTVEHVVIARLEWIPPAFEACMGVGRMLKMTSCSTRPIEESGHVHRLE